MTPQEYIDNLPTEFGVFEITIQLDEECFDHYGIRYWLVRDNVGTTAIGQGLGILEAMTMYYQELENFFDYFGNRKYENDSINEAIPYYEAYRNAIWRKLGWSVDD